MRRFSKDFGVNSSPQYVRNGELLYPIEDSLFEIHPWLAKDTPVEELPQLERPEINGFYLGHILKVYSFFVRFDEMIHGPEFTKEELLAAIVSLMEISQKIDFCILGVFSYFLFLGV